MSINIINSFAELNKIMDSNYLEIAKKCNVLKLGDTKDIMSNEWYKNTYIPRIKNLNIIDYIIDEGYEKIDGFEYIKEKYNIDSESINSKFEERIKAKFELLNFERSYLIQNHRKEDDVLVYYGDKGKIKYSFKNNGAKQVIFIFQSSWAELSTIHNSRKKITNQIYKDVTKHEKYQFYGFAKNNLEYDFVFIQDDNSYIYGWFTWNAGNCILEDHVNFIEKFSEKYERTHIIGASKGGYGALHVGKKCKNIDSINLLAPVVSLKVYKEKTHYKPLYDELFSTKDPLKIEEYLYKVEKIENTKNISTKVNCITGEKDYNYEKICSLENELQNFSCQFAEKNLNHGEIITSNYKEFLWKNLGLK